MREGSVDHFPGQIEPAHDEVLVAGGGDDVLAGGDALGHVAAAQDDPRTPRGEVAGRLQADSWMEDFNLFCIGTSLILSLIAVIACPLQNILSMACTDCSVTRHLYWLP